MGIVQVVITIVVLMVISAVIGAVAKALNGWAEANANRRAEEERRARMERAERAAERARAAQDERAERPRPAPAAATADSGSTGGGVRPASSDMDRFLAEIDRLRRKQATTADPPPAQPGSAPPVAPVVQPIKPPASERPRPRVVAELADPTTAPAPAAPAERGSFGTSPQAPTRTAPVAGQVEELPVASVLRPTSSTGAPATRVTRLATRPRPASKTNLGKNLTALLASGQGVAIAVVLQEVLGPPKCQQRK